MNEMPTVDPHADLPSAGGPCTAGPCNEAKEHVWDVIDGEMSADDCARIKAHIADCPPCDEMYHNERKVKDVVARACGCESAPQDLRGRVTAMIMQLRFEACGSRRGQQSESESGKNQPG